MPIVQCSKCHAEIPRELYNVPQLSACPGCDSPVRALVFPRFAQSPARVLAERAAQGEAVCYYHALKRATTACDQCGRFVCALCSLDLGSGQVFCPNCAESGLRKDKIPTVRSDRRLYDSQALMMATVPILLVWPTLLTAPIALFLAIRHWNSPRTLVPRSRIRLVLAILLSLTTIGLWIVVIVYLFQLALAGR